MANDTITITYLNRNGGGFADRHLLAGRHKRHLRNTLLIDQERLNSQPVALQSSKSMASPHGQSVTPLPKPNSVDENHALPDSQAAKPTGTLPRHLPAHGADPVDDPAREPLPEKHLT